MRDQKSIRVGIVGPCPPPHGGVTRLIGNQLAFWGEFPIRSWLIPLVVPDRPEPYPNVEVISHEEGRTVLTEAIAGALRLGKQLAPMSFSSVRNLLSFQASLRQAVRDNQLDVLYAHHATATGLIAVKEAQRAGIPCLLVAYGETWLSQKGDRRWRRGIEYSVRSANWVVSTSEHCRRGGIARGANAARTSVIYAGIDLERFRPGLDGGAFRKTHDIPDEAVVISVLGLALRRKLDTFLDSLAPLLNVSSVHVLIGGTGADAKYLEERLAILNTGRVKALGFVPEKDLPHFYAATDVLVVSPRTLVECMGQSMKEAMACGRVVVGPDLGGVPEAVQDGANGLLFRPEDPADLVRVLRELIVNGELRRSMGERGRKFAESKFDAIVSARQTFDLLERLVREWQG